MRRKITLFLLLSMASSASVAGLKPPTIAAQPVTDPSMVIDDRGSPLEVLPTQRALRATSASGAVVQEVVAASATDAIGPGQLGVVYNHAMRVQGFITGEIAFRLKGGAAPTSDFAPDDYPGLQKLTEPDVYLVVARSAAEFVELTKRLQQRADVDWVEPVVIYGAPIARPNATPSPQ